MSKRELLKGSTETLLLSLLTREPMYGYQIVKEMEKRSSGYFRLPEGTLYPALHRMMKDGLVEGRWSTAPSGQLRRYYHITADGQKALADMQQEWAAFARAVSLVVQS
ncbi:MAG: helix-turn-helix transcriptional regulator [Chloroflexi bacterium]|nr:helix-turn-helix transcriptional regulator [Chloroflexota bacterium]